MNLGDFSVTIDLDYFYSLLDAGDPFSIAWKLIKDGGWLAIIPLIIMGAWRLWVVSRQNMYDSTLPPLLLALDIPKDNEQSPKAVEHIFNHLWSMYSGLSLIDKYWEGRYVKPVCMEIVGDSGYIQFYIRTFQAYRDMVEAAIYAQYPNAIITEVADYVEPFKKVRFPNSKYNLWGTEMKFMKKDVYPIRTYEAFEHTLSQELKDPMSSLLEILGRLQPDEHVWLQLVATPITGEWTEAGDNLVKKLAGLPTSAKKKGLVQKAGDIPLDVLMTFNKNILGWSPEASSKKEDGAPMMQRITPGEIESIKAVQNKISKAGFSTVFRMIYVSPKTTYLKFRGITGIMGALNQFNTLNLNAIIKDKKRAVDIDYFFPKTRKNYRRNLLLKKYIGRSTDGTKIILNSEELATLFHFPVMKTKPAMLSTVEAKRVEPPTYLPIDKIMPVKEDKEVELKPESQVIDEQAVPSLDVERLTRNLESQSSDHNEIPWDLLGEIEQKDDIEKKIEMITPVTELPTAEIKTVEVKTDQAVDLTVNNSQAPTRSISAPSNLPFVK